MLLYHSNAGGAIFPIIFFARGRKIRSTDVQRDVKTMEKTLQSLSGLPVVCAGKRVGRVAQAALSDDLRRMDGLWVDAGLGGARFVPSEAIEVLGAVSVTVDAPGKREKLKKRPLFRRAVTTDGARLGAAPQGSGQRHNAAAILCRRGLHPSGRGPVRAAHAVTSPH